MHNDSDIVLRLPVNKNHRKQDPSLPEFLIVRLIGSQISTRTGVRETMWFATSLLDAEAYPADEILALYAGRQEPRATRREIKHYPRLKIIRKQWKDQWRNQWENQPNAA